MIATGIALRADVGVEAEDAALLRLLTLLDTRFYTFVTPTPETHARVVARSRKKVTLEDILGWSRSFRAGECDPDVLALLHDADAIERAGDRLRATIRVSRLHDRLFVHSAYPTVAEDAVFFGPDSYRFADFIARELDRSPVADGLIVDIGTGAGVGAIVAADRSPQADVLMTDINPKALRFARINARHAGIRAETRHAPVLDGVTAPIALALANPPYIVDPAGRLYRHGGDMHGAALSLRMATAAMARLRPGGRMLLYTGSAIVGGRDALCHRLHATAAAADCTLRYREIDPDIFGEELANPAYAGVDRIAAVGAVITRGPDAR